MQTVEFVFAYHKSMITKMQPNSKLAGIINRAG